MAQANSMQYRKILIPVVLVIAAAVALVFWLRKSPPLPARMLPEADGYVYVDLRPMRAAGLFKRLPEIQLDPEYQDFVKQTGIQLERDLDQAAFAVHLPHGPGESENRSSEVFVGRFHAEKLRSFLKGIAASTQEYRNHTVFDIPLPGRTVRTALLGSSGAPWGLGASNTGTPEAIHHMLDSQATWFRGAPALLRSYYPQVPLGSPVWAILRATSENGNPTLTLPGGFRLGVPEGTVVVASLRYTGDVEFRAEAFTSDATAAERLASHLGAYLTVVRAIRSRAKTEGAGDEFQKLLDSIRLEKHENGVVLTASVSPKLLEKIVAPQQHAAPKTRP
jgi:hypothetical protein